MRIFLGAFVALFIFIPFRSFAEIKVIESQGSYIMGDNDSKIDARRIAVQEAKRKSLEMAGTYLESLTEVKNMALAKDEIRAYTAGVLETDIVSEEMKGTAEHPEILIKVKCRIDTDVLVNQISSFRKDEELKEQLDAAMKENKTLKKERDNLISKLSSEKDKSKAEDIRKKLDTVLSREESAEDLNKIWRKFASKTIISNLKTVKGMSQAELDEAAVKLEKIIKVSPENQMAHVLLAEIYKERGRDAEALKEFKFLEQLSPNKPHLLFSIGMTYKEMQDCDNAVSYLKKFLVSVKNRKNFPAKMKHEAIEVMKECKAEPPKKRIREKPLRRR